MRKVLVVLVLVVLVLAVLAVALSGCGALADKADAEAERMRAEAGLERARGDAAAERAQAEVEKVRAQTDALAERASVRQVERDATLERALVLLPVLALVLGAVAVGVVAVLALTRRGSVGGVDPVVVLLLERQERRLNELERGVWHSIAQSQRARLPMSDGAEVLVRDLPEDGGAVSRW